VKTDGPVLPLWVFLLLGGVAGFAPHGWAEAAEAEAARAALEKISLPAGDVGKVLSGKFVEASLAPSSERELSIALAFLVDTAPAALVTDLDHALAITDDPDTLSFAEIDPKHPERALGKVNLTEAAARRWLAATAGEAINLSAHEFGKIASLREQLQGKTAIREPVTAAVREILLARYRRYRDEGLAGIAPYDRGDGTVIDAGGELRKASLAARTIGLFRPNFYELLLDYPKFRPAGFEESFFWIHYRAHGEPAFMLTHRLSVPSDPEAGSVQRQFYVSRSYNVEQSLSTLLSVREGTLVVYTNRTSTDQVTGFGAAARRSIGRKLLASQLEGLYTRVRADAAKRP